MKIFDTFMFFNELDLLKLRLNTLDPYVDYFVISEATKTFSGKEKPLYYLENKHLFSQFEHKIIHNVVKNTPDSFAAWTAPHPYFTDRNVSYKHKSGGKLLCDLSLDFQREVYQRDSVINSLLDVAQDDDLILSSDADEIPDPKAIAWVKEEIKSENTLYHFRQKWFMYYLNNYCNKEWFGSRACKFGFVKNMSIDLIRYPMEDRNAQDGIIVEDGGWHFSFLGGAEKVRMKLEAYSYQGRRTTMILKLINFFDKRYLQRRIERNKDIFLDGRRFETISLDSTFPSYLLLNREAFEEHIKE